MAEASALLLVADASLVVPLIVAETSSEAAASLLSGDFRLIAPSLMVAEVTSALRRKVATGEIEASEAEHGLAELLSAIDDGAIRLVRDEDLAAAALRIAVAEGHKIWDCFYIALAEAERSVLATADLKQARIAKARGITLFRMAS